MAQHDDEEISAFMEGLGLKEYAEKLQKENISMEILRCMTADDLRKIGITFGHSFKIIKALEKSMKDCKNNEQPIGISKDERDLGDRASVKESKEYNVYYPSVKEKISSYRHHQGGFPIKVPPNAEAEADELVELGDEVRIILLGKSGSGKSATGNTILGKDGKFNELSSATSKTVQCKRGCAERFKKDIHVVDTPGLFDTNSSNEDVQAEIKKLIHITAPGPHAFILVLGLTRFTAEEYDAVTHFVNYFGEKVYDYFIILFTRKDDLEYESKTLEDHLQTIPENLKEIVEKCGNRCIAFNNRARGWYQERQVNSLLKMIQTNIKKKGQKYYTYSMYEETTKVMKEREEQIRREMEEKNQRNLINVKEEIEKYFKNALEEEQKRYREMEKRKEREIDYLKEIIERFRNESEEQRRVFTERENLKEREMHTLRKNLHEMASKFDSLRKK